MTGGVLIRRLTRRDEAALSETAAWLSREWGLALGYTPAETLDWCQSVVATQDQCILIASRNHATIGTVMVVENDLETETNLTPWLSALYVVPAQRGLGLGRHLIEAASDFARKTGAADLYLYAGKGRLIPYYTDLDWQAFDAFTRNGTDFVVMKKALE